MKLVIDIPEGLVCDGFERTFTEEEKNILIKAIGNGTPLPKGHGRLIDADKLELDDGYSNYDGYYHKYSQSQIYNAPTIIEADTAESEV